MSILKKEIYNMFLRYGKEKETARMAIYHEDLAEYPEARIIGCIKQTCKTSDYLPTVANILSTIELRSADKYEIAWHEFKKTMNNNLRFMTIPGWVYTIKLRLGRDRCEQMGQAEEPFFKRDFMKIFKLVEVAAIELQKDPREYTQVGGASISIPWQIEPHRLSKDIRQTLIDAPEQQKKIGTGNVE